MTFKDIETGELLTVEDLKKEWIENGKQTSSGDPCTLNEFISVCLTINNGTLEIVK